MKQDLSTCPGCGGPADNGHDRCYPPNPYYCKKCMDVEALRAERDELKRDAERLDWLERQDYFELSFALFQDQPNDGKRGVSVGAGWHIGNTMREAIDAAMKEKP